MQRMTKSDSPLESIPTPEEVRERLVQNAREGRLLRSLLKLAKQVADQPARGQQKGDVG